MGAKVFKDLGGNYDVVGTFCENSLFDDLRQLDITERSSVLQLVSDIKPETIIHAAAIASRSQCANGPQEAIATNAHGTKSIVEAANRQGASVIYVSTLGVIEPDSLYGRTKLLGEEHVKDTEAGYDLLRASMIYGYSPNTLNERPFNKIIRTLQDGEPTEYDDSWMFQPTFLHNLSEVIQQILESGPRNRTVDVVIPEFKTRFEIASDILEPLGKQVQSRMKRQSRTKTETHRTTDPEFPEWTYEDMIQTTIEEIKTHGLASV